jgi:hypothetical protein
MGSESMRSTTCLGGLLTIAAAALVGLAAEDKRKEDPCKIKTELPVATTANKYTVDYKSGTGEQCRSYSVRNQAKGVKTPISWMNGKEVLLNATIARCSDKANPCDWITVIRVDIFDHVRGKTSLSYGINKDEYSEEVTAYKRADAESKVDKEKRSLITKLTGAVGGEGDETFKVDIRVTSAITEEGLVYTLSIDGNDGEKLLVANYNADVLEPILALDWDAGEPFAQQLKSQLSKEIGLSLDSKRPAIRVVVKKPTDVKRIVVRNGLLRLRFKGKPIAVATAPAYVTSKE